eukprot:3145080-Pleurochrysis_carterae.AAC.3
MLLCIPTRLKRMSRQRAHIHAHGSRVRMSMLSLAPHERAPTLLDDVAALGSTARLGPHFPILRLSFRGCAGNGILSIDASLVRCAPPSPGDAAFCRVIPL